MTARRQFSRSRGASWVVVLVWAGAVTLGCKRQAPTPSDEPAPTSSVGLQPLQSRSAVIVLSSSEASTIELRIPIGISQPAAVVSVLGMDKPLLTTRCADWHERTAKRAFVLCCTGPEQNLEASGQIDWYERELRVALRATKRKFGGYVSAQTVTLVGLAPAAEAVVALVRKTPALFSRIALVNGGFGSWSAVDSARFAQIQGSRALLVCDSKDCELQASRVTATLRASGAAVRLLMASTSQTTRTIKCTPFSGRLRNGSRLALFGKRRRIELVRSLHVVARRSVEVMWLRRINPIL